MNGATLHRPLALAVALVSLAVAAATAQTRTVAGRVTDARTDRPVATGWVAVKGTAIRDALRPDGVFVLHVPPRDVTIVVHATGFQATTLAVPIHEETVFVALARDALELTALDVGAASVDGRKNRTAAGELVHVAEMDPAPTASVPEFLQGRVAGDIQGNSGVPGGDLQVRLRGVTTILGSSAPLYVLDGVIVSDATIGSGLGQIIGGQPPVPSRIADLNHHDIESLEILKGAAATTLYGSKGANGVVVIQTKRTGRRQIR